MQKPDPEFRVRIDADPAPSEEEMVAIVQTLNVLSAHNDSCQSLSNDVRQAVWSRTARCEALRPRHWPLQSSLWNRARE
jgi:hypothetical protein